MNLGIEVDGLREFQFAARRAADVSMPKRLGQAHKEVGQLVIDRLEPRPTAAATGTGAGATVRPSASKREVQLRAGGKHRIRRTEQLTHFQQWGKRFVPVAFGQRRPKRPYIMQTVRDNRREIEREFLDKVAAAVDPAFHDVDVKG